MVDLTTRRVDQRLMRRGEGKGFLYSLGGEICHTQDLSEGRSKTSKMCELLTVLKCYLSAAYVSTPPQKIKR